MSPTARTLQRLRKSGYVVGVVERWNPGARVRQDYLGFADILAVKVGIPGVLAVQATTASNQASRITKIAGLQTPSVWLGAGNLLEVWGWAKRGPRVGRKTWSVTITNITLNNNIPTPEVVT